MVTKEISLLNWLNPSLDTREAATRLFEMLRTSHPPCSEIEFDFSGILFMSRSFADQFHKERMAFQADTNSLIVLKNAAYDFIQTLEVVARTQTSRRKVSATHQVLTFSKLGAMQDYMFAW